MRKIRRLVLGVGAFAALLLLLMVFLAYTRPGLSLLVTAARQLAGVELSYATLDGRLNRLRVSDLELRAAGVELTASELSLDWSPGQLLGKVVEIQQLAAGEVVVKLPPAEEPAGPPPAAPPESLALPFTATLTQGSIASLAVHAGDGTPFQAKSIALSLDLGRDLWRIIRGEVTIDERQLRTSGTLAPEPPFEHDLSLELSAEDESAALRLQGNLLASSGSLRGRQGPKQLTVDPLELRWEAPHWAVAAAASTPGLTTNVNARLSASELLAGEITFEVAADHQTATGTLTAAGPFTALDATLTADLTAQLDGRAPAEPLALQSRLQLQGFRQLDLRQLSVEGAGVSLSGGGIIALDELQADLDLTLVSFPLALIDPRLDDTLAGELRSRSALNDGVAETRVETSLQTAGSELAMDGHVVLAGAAPQSALLTLSAGADNRVALDLKSPSELLADLDVASLSAFWPDLAGAVKGELSLNPQIPVTGLHAVLGELSAVDLEYQNTSVARLDLQLGPDELKASAGDARVGAELIEGMTLDVQGSPGEHTFSGMVESQRGMASVEGRGRWVDGEYSYAGLELELTPTNTAPLRGTAPWSGDLSSDSLTIPRSCLQGAGLSACFSARRSPGAWAFTGEVDVPRSEDLAWRPWWPDAPAGLEFSGPLKGEITATRNAADDSLAGSVFLHSLALPGGAQDPQRVQQLSVSVDGSFDRAELTAQAQLPEGKLAASGELVDLLGSPGIDLAATVLAEDLSAYSALTNSLNISRGSARADLTARGALTAPQVTGTFRLDDAAVGVPTLNIEPVINFELELPEAGAGEFSGRISSGQGEARISGTASVAAPLEVAGRLEGSELLLSDSDALSLVASPDLQLLASAQTLMVTGDVVVNRGLLALTSTASGVQASPDVVIVDDPEQTPRPTRTDTSLDVRVIFEQAIPVTGFGLKGELDGTLRVRQRPGQPMLGSGELRLTGTYGAFGQQLTIERGQLVYTETPLNDPSIDLFAYREVGDTRVGVRVTGRTSNLSAVLESEPPMNESDQLALLVLGQRASGGLDENQSDQLAAAALSLALTQGNRRLRGVGDGGVLPQVSLTQELGGLALAIGKQISPRLYVGYTVDLLEPIRLIRLRYRISDTWTAETELGDESKAAVRYRIERD
ncbi:MAG: translocation/assembly module TamB domain-containing protein [Pseudomonadota bacterium]